MLKITKLGKEKGLCKYVGSILFEVESEYGDMVEFMITEGDAGRLTIRKVKGYMSIEPCNSHEVDIK